MSCSTEDAHLKTGKIQFNFSNQFNGRQSFSSETASVVLSISKSNGSIVHEMLTLDLFSFGNGYVSESIELPIGDYMLTTFLILDSENNVTYACPVEGSEHSQFVSDPLPIYFNVSENGTTTVVPQVLEVTSDDDPASFGYVNFGFEIVTPIDTIGVNQIKLSIDGETWEASEVDSVVFNSDGNWLAMMGRIFTNDTTYEHVFIKIQDYNFTTGEMPEDKLEIEMAFHVSLSNGTGNFYNTEWGQSKNVSVSITEYDSIAQTISGTFSGYIYDRAGVTKKIIKDGVFNKLRIM